VAVLLALVGIFYLRPGILLGTDALGGSDYGQLHVRRIRFARDALFGSRHALPGWYPHEVLGAPFAANLQSFPWIPTRLLLLALDPSIAYAPAVVIAAALSAIFTFLYCRRAGLTRLGAVAAGGTFVCAGYFASRVMAGHLPLLEAYPALPLLLWLVDRAFAPERAARRRFDLGMLAFSSACIVAAGHPQLPAYSLASALLYTLWHRKREVWRISGAITLGAGLALAAWWPMLLLIARSTRVLRLARADNDIAMPYARLLALIVPGIHGWPRPVDLAESHLFAGYPNMAYFWDTASYIGILPLVAIAALLIICVVRRRIPDPRWKFLAYLGTAAFLCSLPLASPLLHLLPGTLLRSPARLLYLSTFCVAVALGVAVDEFQGAAWPRFPAVRTGIVVAVLALHFGDLWGFAHWFIQTSPRNEDPPEFQALLDRDAGDYRIAEQREYRLISNEDRFDDAGGFDSIFLARFYQGLLALSGAPLTVNRQWIDASTLPVKTLEATGVRFVITDQSRTDLELESSDEDSHLYRVSHPATRAGFYAQEHTGFAGEQWIPELFAANPRNLLLPSDAQKYRAHPAPAEAAIREAVVVYARPSSDEVLVRVSSGRAGFVHVLEAYDPGWAATLDGKPAPVIPANGFAMAVPVPAGGHTVRLRYATPGRATGAGLSLLSFVLLAALIGSQRPLRR
jgi:Bacterial membrane protein YfhO